MLYFSHVVLTLYSKKISLLYSHLCHNQLNRPPEEFVTCECRNYHYQWIQECLGQIGTGETTCAKSRLTKIQELMSRKITSFLLLAYTFPEASKLLYFLLCEAERHLCRRITLYYMLPTT